MDQITQEEINDTLEKFRTFEEADILKLMRTFQKKQEPLLVYVAAVAERQDLNDHEYDVLVTMVLMSWEVMRKKFPKLKKLTMKQLNELDDTLFETLEQKPLTMLMDVKDYPQPHLLGTVLEHVMESEDEVREEQKGMIYFTLKNVVDGLIQASGESSA